MYFNGTCLVYQFGQWHTINRKLFKVVIGLQLYSVVCCRRLPDHIAEGNSILNKNGLKVILECPGPCDPVLVPFYLAWIGGLAEADRFL